MGETDVVRHIKSVLSHGLVMLRKWMRLVLLKGLSNGNLWSKAKTWRNDVEKDLKESTCLKSDKNRMRAFVADFS